ELRLVALSAFVLQVRVGLPKHQIAVPQRRQRSVRIDGLERIALLVAFEVIDLGQRVVGTQQLETGDHLATVHRDGISKEFHDVSSRKQLPGKWPAILAPGGPRAPQLRTMVHLRPPTYYARPHCSWRTGGDHGI